MEKLNDIAKSVNSHLQTGGLTNGYYLANQAETLHQLESVDPEYIEPPVLECHVNYFGRERVNPCEVAINSRSHPEQAHRLRWTFPCLRTRPFGRPREMQKTDPSKYVILCKDMVIHGQTTFAIIRYCITA